jgi:membrane-associated phospholipid phosphatase
VSVRITTLPLLAGSVIAGISLAPVSVARADAEARVDDDIGWEYLLDGGAVPFVYATGITALSLRLLVEPPETPRFFSESEGGEAFSSDTISEAAVTGYLSLGALTVGLVPADDSRMFHLKGYAEAILTTLALTEISKATVGRHRPHFSPDETDPDQRRSFFSGHSSLWFATSTYLGLYLNAHVFSRWRDDDDFAFWTFVPAAALLGGSIYVASTRVDDNRHHLSDVLVGAGVGTATSLIFYWYQESRYRDARARLGAGEYSVWERIQIAPWGRDPGVTVMMSF